MATHDNERIEMHLTINNVGTAASVQLRSCPSWENAMVRVAANLVFQVIMEGDPDEDDPEERALILTQ